MKGGKEMAVADVNYFSNVLMRQVTYRAVVPAETASAKAPFKTLYLLHGIKGDYTDWVVHTRVAKLAMAHNMAVIMPSGENSFYVDHKSPSSAYGEFIGSELVQETRKLFPLSHKREDTYIAGLSMGGYGAIRNGLKYHDTFGALAGLSSALILDNAVESTEDAEWILAKRSFYESVFGDLSKLKGSDKDPEALIRQIKKENGAMPRIYLACGTEDRLIDVNHKFRDFLTAEGVDHTYEESNGIHDWKFWDEYIEKVLNWLEK
jgi:Predicted esterase